MERSKAVSIMVISVSRTNTQPHWMVLNLRKELGLGRVSSLQQVDDSVDLSQMRLVDKLHGVQR